MIATSSGAAVAYVRESFSNLRVGMLLEIAMTLGATGGALLAAHVAPRLIAIIFGLVLLASVYFSVRGPSVGDANGPPDRLARRLRLDSQYPARDGIRPYHVRNVLSGSG